MNNNHKKITKRVILITGGTGFIGQYIIRHLKNINHYRIRILTRDEKKAEKIFYPCNNIEIVQGNLQNIDSLRKAVNGVDEVIHLAAEVSSWGDKSSYFNNNVLGTKNLYSAIKEMEKPVWRIISASSIAVYGCPDCKIITENTPVQKTGWPYADTKIEMENVIREFKNFVPSIILRIGDVIGPESTWVKNPLKLLKLRLLFLINHSEGILNYIDIRDLVDLIEILLDSNINNTIYNVSSGEYTIFNDYFRDLAIQKRLPAPLSLPKKMVKFLIRTQELFCRIFNMRTESTLHTLNYISCARHISIGKVKAMTHWIPKIPYKTLLNGI